MAARRARGRHGRLGAPGRRRLRTARDRRATPSTSAPPTAASTRSPSRAGASAGGTSPTRTSRPAPPSRTGSCSSRACRTRSSPWTRRTGTWRWHHRRENKRADFTILGAAAVAAGPEAVYAAYSDGFVAALDPASGAARWERQIAPAGDHLDVDALLLEGGRLYAAAYSGAVLALDAATGETRWTSRSPGAAQLALAEGLVVVVTPASVHGLAPADGASVWTTPLGGGAPAGAPVVAGPWMLVPADGGGLRWLEAASGRTLRVFDPGTGVSGSPAVAGARVYVLSNGGDLLALDLS